ncbi:MAG: DUF4832 domain-containing protein, partial [Acetomicrobium sp.]|nr:DUF4832 domain-containing protein [Acetomicrobium sp.]
ASPNDLTYPHDSIFALRKYLEQDSLFAPVGGETCKDYPPRTNCSTAVQELRRFHFTYLNAQYHPDVIKRWKTEGCYDRIACNLGYRLVLRTAHFEDTVKVGSEFTVKVKIENKGWAAPLKSRRLVLSFGDTSSQHLQVFLSPHLSTLQSGTTDEFHATVKIPSDFPSGYHSLSLAAPDNSIRLQGRPEYSLPFENEEFDVTKGILKLGVVHVFYDT